MTALDWRLKRHRRDTIEKTELDRTEIDKLRLEIAQEMARLQSEHDAFRQALARAVDDHLRRTHK